jgi:hypothetical protein
MLEQPFHISMQLHKGAYLIKCVHLDLGQTLTDTAARVMIDQRQPLLDGRWLFGLRAL